MDIPVLNIKGEDTGRKVSLKKEIFGIEPNDHAIYLDVKRYMATKRQGTHKSKERAEITGSTKKIKRQKGTGTARAGSIKSPIFRGGGRAFGPRPKNYNIKLNKKLKQLAKKSALSYKAKSKEVTVIEDFTFDEIKTKKYNEMLKHLGLTDNKSMLILSEKNENVLLSSRNIKQSKVALIDEINTYDLLNADKLLFCESSVEKLENKLS